MGRNALPDAKINIASRVAPRIAEAIDRVRLSMDGRPSGSRTVEILLEESPRIKAALKNGNKKK